MSTSASELRLPESPAGRQLAWFLAHSATQGAGLTVDEIADHMAFGPTWTPADSLQRFQTADPRPWRLSKISSDEPFALEVVLDYGDDRPWKVSCKVDEAPPHRITWNFWTRAIAEDIVIRPAVATDGPALNGLEVQAPMQLGDTTLVYDRGEDFLGFGRLMGDNICFVAEREGQLLGMACGALHRVRIGGADYSVMLLHHLRVPVEHRKGGIFSSLNGHVFGAHDGRSDGAYGYTALDNAEGMRIGGPGTWSITVYRAVLDCAALAGRSHGRWATAADAATIVDVLNAAHEGEEAYLPYTVESFTERMTRAPELYTWEHVLIGDGAVLGVWPARLMVTIDEGQGGASRRAVRAVVLDHGFVPGAGGAVEFERLLRAWCARLVDLGHTEVTFITSEGAPSHDVVIPLAAHVDPYSFRMAVPEPPGTRDRGLYVDAIYF